ncbi:MAG: hypothetical protein ACJ759_16725, partial [Thermoanaerobaculia bacterium]
LHQAGNTVLLVTHEPDIAVNAWRQVQLRDGKVTDDHPTARANAALAGANVETRRGASPGGEETPHGASLQ